MIARAGTTVGRFDRIRVALPCLVVFAALLIAAAAAYAQAPKVAPITIVINQSPWFASFSKVVDAYEKETGNKVDARREPVRRAAPRSSAIRCAPRTGQFDLLVMNSSWLAEFYHGGFLDAAHRHRSVVQARPGGHQLRRHGLLGREDEDATARRPACPMACRSTATSRCCTTARDLYEKAGLKVPQTWDELVANAAKLHDPPAIYGIVQRGARSASDISYDWMPYLHGCNGAIFTRREGGRLHRHDQQPRGEEGARLLRRSSAKKSGPPNPGSYGPGAGDPGAADRQGGACDAGDRRVAADGRSARSPRSSAR